MGLSAVPRTAVPIDTCEHNCEGGATVPPRRSTRALRYPARHRGIPGAAGLENVQI